MTKKLAALSAALFLLIFASGCSSQLSDNATSSKAPIPGDSATVLFKDILEPEYFNCSQIGVTDGSNYAYYETSDTGLISQFLEQLGSQPMSHLEGSYKENFYYTYKIHFYSNDTEVICYYTLPGGFTKSDAVSSGIIDRAYSPLDKTAFQQVISEFISSCAG